MTIANETITELVAKTKDEGGAEVTIKAEVKLSGAIEDLLEDYGADAVAHAARSHIKQSMLNLMKRCWMTGMNNDGIQDAVDKWKPGTRRSSIDPVVKVLNKFDGLTPEQKEELRERLAA